MKKLAIQDSMITVSYSRKLPDLSVYDRLLNITLKGQMKFTVEIKEFSSKNSDPVSDCSVFQ